MQVTLWCPTKDKNFKRIHTDFMLSKGTKTPSYWNYHCRYTDYVDALQLVVPGYR